MQIELFLFFYITVLVKYLLKYGQFSIVYAASPPFLWDQEEAGQTQELC